MIYNFNTRPYLVINGKDSRSINGLIVSTLPMIALPPKRTKTEEIDGRDGDIVSVLGYAAYDKTFEIGLKQECNVDDVIAFFNTSGKVVFGNEPDKFYNFANYELLEFEKLLRLKKAVVTFHVQPFKYSDSEGEKVYQFNGNTGTLTAMNAGNIYSRPKITIKGAGNVDLYINGGKVLEIALPIEGKTIIIDGAEMEATDIEGNFANRLVTGNYDNIILKPGTNEIEARGAISEVKISAVSRWI